MQKLYFCTCEKIFFALRRKYRRPRQIRTYPECKNYIFALAKKYFSHSGENTGDLGKSERIRSAKIIFLHLRKNIFRTPEKIPET
ncbi:Uncharacterized protein dnm_061470 [Desulfonema magnum]|uniref:Uncharacterized protein n=1 Tax=Desulfonema magnum TaxID=45655 RepID=A0A975GQI9_9BACT|nr:Uncharacterized protein dnm_061470 [Desulfonema magnum]